MSTGNACLMRLYQHVSAGKPMAELISELVWQPMGAKEDADYTVDHFRTPDYNGAMCTTLHGQLSDCIFHL